MLCNLPASTDTGDYFFFRFSTAKLTWTRLDKVVGLGTAPSARSYHALSSVGHDLFLFGGLSCGGYPGIGETDQIAVEQNAAREVRVVRENNLTHP